MRCLAGRWPITLLAIAMCCGASSGAAYAKTLHGSYDGTYYPNDVAPPIKQTTWGVVFVNMGLDIFPNMDAGVPTPGVADLLDNNNGRLQISDVYTDDDWGNNAAEATWVFEMRLKMISVGGVATRAAALAGMRDEGGEGKSAMFGWTTDNRVAIYSLGNLDTDIKAFQADAGVVGSGFHDYRLEKYFDEVEGAMKVALTVTEVLNPLNTFNLVVNYDDLADDGTGLGPGYYTSSTSFQSHAVIDSMEYVVTLASDAVPGDFNGDGNVDGADFVVWQTNFPNNTGEATLATGDANGDGNVDGADFVVWQTNFPFNATPQSNVVPEPHAAAMAAMCAFCLFAGSVIAGRRKHG